MVNFATVARLDNGGTVQFVYGSRVETGWDGAVGATVRLASAGRVELSATLESPLLALGETPEELAKGSEGEVQIPRYPPVEFLPCENTVDQSPCLAGQNPPPLESATMTPATGTATTFQIPNLGSDKIQLWVRVCDPNLIGPCQFINLAQKFPPCGTLGANEYCVNGDTGTVTFGSAQTAPVTAWFRRVVRITQGAPGGFGSIIPDLQARSTRSG